MGTGSAAGPALSIKVAFQAPSGDVEQPGGGGVGALCDLLAGKPESQQIREHQHPGGVIDHAGFMIDR